MKLYKYIIEHTKDTNTGKDIYKIYKLWFGFFKTPFIETEVFSSEHMPWEYIKQQYHYEYDSFEGACYQLKRYIEQPYLIYKDHRLDRCHNSMWIEYDSIKKSPKYYEFYYKVAGSLEQAKHKIDEEIEREKNRKFKKIINVNI